MTKKKIIRIIIITVICYLFFMVSLFFLVRLMLEKREEKILEDYTMLAEEAFAMLDNGQLEMYERYANYELLDICSSSEICDIIENKRVLDIIFYEEDVVFIVIDQVESFRGDSGYAIVRNSAIPQREYPENTYEGLIHYEQVNERIYSFSVSKM